MGIFSTNRFDTLNYDDSTDIIEGYCGEAGLELINLESFIQDNEFFTTAIMKDFAEAAAIMEADGSRTDGVVTRFKQALDSVKEVFIKVKKAIFGFFKDATENINKSIKEKISKVYSNNMAKIKDKDLSNFKVTYEKPKSTSYDFPTLDPGVTNKYLNDVINDVKNGNFDADKRTSEPIVELLRLLGQRGVDLASKDIKDDNANTTDAILKVYHRACFDEPKEENLKYDDIKRITDILADSSKIINPLKQTNKKIEQSINNTIAIIDKLKKSAADSNDSATKALCANYSTINSYLRSVRKCAIDLAKASIKEARFALSQANKVFSKALAYNDKKDVKKESAIDDEDIGALALEFAMYESLEYEISEAF